MPYLSVCLSLDACPFIRSYVTSKPKDKEDKTLIHSESLSPSDGQTHFKKNKLEFGMYPQSMPTEWTHVRTVRA